MRKKTVPRTRKQNWSRRDASRRDQPIHNTRLCVYNGDSYVYISRMHDYNTRLCVYNGDSYAYISRLHAYNTRLHVYIWQMRVYIGPLYACNGLL